MPLPTAWLADPDALVRGRWQLGSVELTVCTDGPFALDGGAMFGVVPKTLWQRVYAADAENRVQLGLNTLVIRTAEALVVVETGLGNKLSAKQRAFVGNHERLPASLAAAGVNPAEVTHVINTHLHWDHCGWNTTLGADGEVRPTFPQARYFAAAGELAHGRLQLERDRVSYLAPNYDPLIRTGQLTLLDLEGKGGYRPDDLRLRNAAEPTLPPVAIQQEAEIVPGVWVETLPGHTASMLAVHVESRGGDGTVEHACYVSDLMPTSRHLQPTWAMGFDLDPLRVIEERKRFLHRAVEGGWLVIFTHDHEVPGAWLAWDGVGKPTLRAES